MSIEEGGKVTFLQRLSGTFASYHTLEEFPFDRQAIKIMFFSLDWSAEKRVIRNDPVFSGVGDMLNISDWSV